MAVPSHHQWSIVDKGEVKESKIAECRACLLFFTNRYSSSQVHQARISVNGADGQWGCGKAATSSSLNRATGIQAAHQL